VRHGDAEACEDGAVRPAATPGEPVHRLPEEVGLTVVPSVLLDQVEQDPSQAGRLTASVGAPAKPLQAGSASASVTKERERAVEFWEKVPSRTRTPDGDAPSGDQAGSTLARMARPSSSGLVNCGQWPEGRMDRRVRDPLGAALRLRAV
jgi:hypothetical protein